MLAAVAIVSVRLPAVAPLVWFAAVKVLPFDVDVSSKRLKDPQDALTM